MIPGTSARKLPTFISLTHQISWEGNKNPFFSGPILGIQSSLFKTTVPQETRTKICPAAWIAVSGQTGLRSDKNRLSQALSILFTRRQSRGGSRGGARGARPPLFLHQTRARRAEKSFLETAGPPPPPPSPYLNV